MCGKQTTYGLHRTGRISYVATILETGIVPREGVRVCDDCIDDEGVVHTPTSYVGRSFRSERIRSQSRASALSSSSSSRLEVYHVAGEEVEVSDEVLALVHRLLDDAASTRIALAACTSVVGVHSHAQHLLFEDRIARAYDVYEFTAFNYVDELNAFVSEVVHQRSRIRGELGRWRHEYNERRCVVICLVYVRTDLTMGQVTSWFQVSSETTCYEICDDMALIVEHLALSRCDGALRFPVTREDQIEQYGYPIHDTMHTNSIDMSYFFTNEPSDIALLRALRDKVFKKRNYVKLLFHWSPHGYCFQVYGPYASAGTANDALSLTANIVGEPEVLAFANLGGVWTVDAGFQGTEAPRKLTIRTTGKRRKSEFGMSSVEKARQTSVTRRRWVAEVGNAHLKDFRRLRSPWDWRRIDKLLRYVRIAAFLHNRLHERFSTTVEMLDE